MGQYYYSMGVDVPANVLQLITMIHLLDNVVYIRAIPLSNRPLLSESDLALLDAKEMARYSHLRNPSEQLEFAWAHIETRRAISEFGHISAHKLNFTHSTLGKPALTPNPQGLKFSFSRTESMAFIAITKHAGVGADIEAVKAFPEMCSLAKTHFSDCEFERYLNSEEQNRVTNFYHIWTQKEAVLKAIGSGLQQPPSSFSTLDKEGNGSLSTDCMDFEKLILESAPAEDWTISSMKVSPKHIASIAVGARGVECIEF